MNWLKGSRRQGRRCRRVLSIFRCSKNSTRTGFSSSSGKTSCNRVLPEVGKQHEISRFSRTRRGISKLAEDESAGRRRCLVNVFFLVLITIIFLQTSAQAADKLRIGLSELIASYSTLPVAQKRGFLQEEGLQAEFIRMGATVGLATLVTGEIDYYTSLGAGVAAAIRGVPVKIVACYVPGPTATLIARPEFKSVQELRGKTIG